MAERGSNQAATKVKVGDVLDLGAGDVVQRPDGRTVTLVDGSYVADVAGLHVVNPATEGVHLLRVT